MYHHCLLRLLVSKILGGPVHITVIRPTIVLSSCGQIAARLALVDQADETVPQDSNPWRPGHIENLLVVSAVGRATVKIAPVGRRDGGELFRGAGVEGTPLLHGREGVRTRRMMV